MCWKSSLLLSSTAVHCGSPCVFSSLNYWSPSAERCRSSSLVKMLFSAAIPQTFALCFLFLHHPFKHGCTDRIIHHLTSNTAQEDFHNKASPLFSLLALQSNWSPVDSLALAWHQSPQVPTKRSSPVKTSKKVVCGFICLDSTSYCTSRRTQNCSDEDVCLQKNQSANM